MVSVKIDTVPVGIENGLEFLRDSSEEFNKGANLKLVNLAQKAPFPDYADVEITVNGDVFEMCIQTDLSKRTSLGVYEHMISLAEPVIKLSQYIHPDRKYSTIDGNKVTWLYIANNLITTQELGKTSPLTIRSDTQDLLNDLDEKAVTKELTGGNLLTTFTDIFRSLNARPTLSLDNEIGHELFGKLGTEITIGDVISELTTSDIADYGLAVHSKIKNGTYEGNVTTGGTYYPAKGYGVTPRSSNDKYQDNDAQYEFDSGIRRNISAIIMNLEIDSTTVQAEVGHFIVSKAEWDDLLTETDASTLYNGKFKNNTFYFVEGDNLIQNVGVKTKNSSALVTGDDAMESLIKSWVIQFSAFDLADLPLIPQAISNIEIQWFYQPIRDLDVRVERHNTDRVHKNATVINNQKDSTLELKRYGEALKSHINRIGNDTFEITIRYTELAAFILWELNDYTSDGYKIVKIKMMTRDNSVDVTYLFTKNQSVLNPLTAVNRQVSPFTITKRNILSCFTYNEYVEFSGTERTHTSQLTTAGIYVMLNALDWFASSNKPVYVGQYFSADASTTGLINMSCMSIPMGQTFAFNVQFQAPRIAGFQLAADGILGHKLVPLSYADENGQVDEFTMWFGSESVVVPDDAPEGSLVSPILMHIPSTEIGLNPDENFGITLHQHVITDRSNLIVADFFMENNSMIKELAGEQAVTLLHYASNPNYTIYDKVFKSGHAGAGSYAINLDHDIMTISGVPTGNSWVIVETNSPNRIYMAYNSDGTDMNTIYINRLKERPNIETL